MKIGHIAYTNTEPFFHNWPTVSPWKLHPGVPRALAAAADEGILVAGPLPIVECWKLYGDFRPLQRWGIATRESSKSVLVLSHKPFSKLLGVTISVTTESSTSVQLCQLLLEQKHGCIVKLKRGFTPDDEARLIIGDQALQVWGRNESQGWRYVTDLATEWWEWKSLPFVFARWVVRRGMEPEKINALTALIQKQFLANMDNLDAIARKKGSELSIPPAKVVDYLRSFIYEIGKDEEESMAMFQELVERRTPASVS